MTALLPVAEAQARVLALGTPLPVEHIPLASAAGRWAATDILALRTQPERDLSSMDGYAIAHADLPGPFRRIGESAAGRPFSGTLGRGEAVRIFTGAIVPTGADCVLVQEEASVDGDMIALMGDGPAHPGRNVRARGLDFTQGDILVREGEQLTPARIALVAIGGHATLPVRRRVRVAIGSSGDELRPIGTPLGEGQLPETNGLMLAAMLAGSAVEIIDLGILADDRILLRECFAAIDADILVTSGGASVGDHDLVQPALTDTGARIDFWRVALRPGKPLLAGRLGDTVVLGLPGNPVSAFVTTSLFVAPLIAHLSGAAMPIPRTVEATLGEPLPANGERSDYLRGSRIDGRVHVAAIQDSSMLRTLTRADCLVIREPHAPAASIGDSVRILPLA